MGLSRWLARLAVRAPHVLLVEAPGGWRVRVAAEQELCRRGWRTSTAPADADVLLVCGHPTDAYGEAIERVWDQMPGPRARIVVGDGAAESVAAELDTARDTLIDDVAQRADARARPPAPPEPDAEFHEHGHEAQSGHGEAHGDHGSSGGHDDMGSAAGSEEHMGHGDMGHGQLGHNQMGHGQMDMPGPGGVALAAGGPDRDGLEMDVLHLRLGPVLACWPAELVLDLSLQGDVVTAADVELVSGPNKGEDRMIRAARRCDAAASVLTLAGRPEPAGRARRVRDLLVAGDGEQALEELRGLRRRVAASRVLRWSLRGLVPVSRSEALPGVDLLMGDVHDRLLRMLDLAAAEVRDGDVARGPDLRELAERLPELLEGSELATVRLAVASVIGLVSGAPVPALGDSDG